MKGIDKKFNLQYAPEAYSFVDNAIKYAVKKLENKRHLTAYEVLLACRETALKEYGFLSEDVLRSWGIKKASDIGEIVYQMIQNNVLSASKDDKKSDFEIQFELFEGKTKIKTIINPRKVHDPIICD